MANFTPKTITYCFQFGPAFLDTVFISVVFTYLKYFPNVTEMVNALMNVFWLSRDRKNVTFQRQLDLGMPSS